jgi:pyridoxamine 5'-phosphate oxidase
VTEALKEPESELPWRASKRSRGPVPRPRSELGDGLAVRTRRARVASTMVERRDPIHEFAAWWDEEQVPVVVATATPEGRPSARAVVLEAFDADGFVFFTSSQSPKAHDLAANPHAALVFLWEGRQVRVEGAVERVSDDENERQWSRTEGKRALAAFEQSMPIKNRAELKRLYAQVPEDPPRPSFWVGYRVVPTVIEFWQLRPEDDVNDRFRFARTRAGWLCTLLQP